MHSPFAAGQLDTQNSYIHSRTSTDTAWSLDNMPKARKRFTKQAERQSEASNPFHTATKLEIVTKKLSQPGLSRGKRKRLERQERLAAKNELVAKLGAAKKKEDNEQKNGKLADMGDMSSFLEDFNTDSKVQKTKKGTIIVNSSSTHGKVSNKTKERITTEEVHHFSQVVEHAAFKANPLAAIAEHLRNTIAAAAAANTNWKTPGNTTHTRKTITKMEAAAFTLLSVAMYLRRTQSNRPTCTDVPRTKDYTTALATTVEDLTAVHALILDLAAFEDSVDKVEVSLDDLIQDQTQFHVMLAKDETNSIVGFGFFSFGYSTWKGRTLSLDDLFVGAAFRNQGVGGLLMAAIAKYGLQHNVKRMDWLSFRWNTPANDFYTHKIQALSNDHLIYWRLQDLERLATSCETKKN